METADLWTLRRVLESWAGGPLKVKAKLSGNQLTYDGGDAFSLYSYEAFRTSPASPAEYFLEGSASITLEAMVERLGALKALLLAEGIQGQYDCVELDEVGSPVGDERSV